MVDADMKKKIKLIQKECEAKGYDVKSEWLEDKLVSVTINKRGVNVLFSGEHNIDRAMEYIGILDKPTFAPVGSLANKGRGRKKKNKDQGGLFE